MDPQDPQWLNRCVLAILRARSELIPDAISDAYNDFAAVKVTAVFDPSLVRDPYIQHLRRQPDEVLHDLRNRNVVPSGTRQHSRHRVFEHLGHGALYLASLGPMVTLNGIDDALVFINACGNHDVVEQIGERAYHLAAQEVSGVDLDEANVFFRLSCMFRDYEPIIRQAAADIGLEPT